MYLEFFPSFPSLPLFLLAFEFPLPVLPLGWGLSDVPLEEVWFITYLEFLLPFPGLHLFKFPLPFLRRSQNGAVSEAMRITTHLELFPSPPSFLLLFLTFKLLSFPFPLRWSQNGIPSEGVETTTYLELLEFHCLIRFLLALA